MLELTARIEALLRRAEKPTLRADYADGEVQIDVASRVATVRGEIVPLTPLEFRLLSVLTEHAGEVVSRSELLQLVWGGRPIGDKQVKVYIGYLRKKIELEGEARLVENVRGFGYRYNAPIV